ncbi:long-chain fatty acid--CoA ligase [Nocardioides eburneiflavus]|uniref:Long-chain fatty acid--CoA ligase n=1 Tax=Nocardioides eburneiflavus TaxID=2518372 RepID=A0A4Z1C3H6_9ACTN|nr:AMP-binding protein [Nocardioides eburneiflavus]TGN63572.1 long-chain fatty acid--CoA ligase [Nocardioides eburneiflavus]
MDLATALRWTTERYPHRRAVGGAAPMSYAEWDARTERYAHALHDLGAAEGSRAIFMLQGGEPLATLHLAAQKARIASLPLSTRFGTEELACCIGDCDPALIAVDEHTYDLVVRAVETVEKPPPLVWAGHPDHAPAGVPSVARPADRAPSTIVPAKPRGEDISVMLYTSGTTGRPKGVPRTHRAEHYAALAHLVQTGHGPGEVTLGVMPLFHTMGLRSLLATVLSAGTWVPQAKFDADEALELIVGEQVSALYLVPTMYWSLMHGDRLGEATSLRNLAYAGASMTPTLAQRLVRTVNPARFVNHYGSTEIYTFTIGPDNISKPGCAGRAGLFSRIRLVDPDPGASPDQVVPDGERGQVIASLDSPEAFAGYWNRPDADARAIRDGWYFTNDLAVADEDGDLWVSGRVDDMINSGGENLYPEEIEHALAACPDLEEVIVAATPHDKWGQAVTAFVVGRPGDSAEATLSKVEQFAREGSGLPSLKRPKRYVVVDQIPKSAVGKILRRRLTAGEFETLADTEGGASA